MIDMPDAIARLANERPIFHSEADFQHALAWLFHSLIPDARVRLEYRPFLDERVYLDIWVSREDQAMAVELKYLTRELRTVIAGEHYHLRSQSARDISRYDFLKDS